MAAIPIAERSNLIVRSTQLPAMFAVFLNWRPNEPLRSRAINA